MCKECIREERRERAKKRRLTQKEFLAKLKEVHGGKYGTDKAFYVKNDEYVILKCPKHGYFNIKPIKLFTGEGCKDCKESKLERKIRYLLKENNIYYISQYHFSWLGIQSLDFYLPDYKIAIECQGRQHFGSYEYFGGDKAFKHRKELDRRKYNLCKENNVKLLYYSEEKEYKEFLGDKLFKDTEELINEIKSYDNETTNKTKCGESQCN